jgi:hypothetical protein
MNGHCNAGKRSTNLVGELPGYETVWYDAKAITNILSLKQIKDKYHVSFDSKMSNAFTVTKPDGTVLKFHESENVLYFLDTSKNMDEVVVLINTVSETKIDIQVQIATEQIWPESCKSGLDAQVPEILLWKGIYCQIALSLKQTY